MALLSVFLVLLLAFLGQAKNLVIPGPDSDHKYKPAIASFSLTDTSRKDPWDKNDRKIAVTLLMPVPVNACKECALPYMPDQTAKISNEQFFGDKKKGVFEKIQIQGCCSSSESIDAAKLPVLVIDGQTDTSRLMYTNLAQYVAANNVAVVLVDHPHDSSIVEFEDKSVAYNSGRTGLSSFSPLTAWNSTVTNALDIRVRDIQFALTSLASQELLARVFPNVKFTSALNTASYAIAGHALGGTVATSLGTSDPRVLLSINLSGSSPPLTSKTSKPVFFIGRQNFLRDNDINWPTSWQYLTGPATEFDLQESELMDFTDLSVIMELAATDGMKGLAGAGLGKQGVWANHALRCFVEGIVKDELDIGDGKSLSHSRLAPRAGKSVDGAKGVGVIDGGDKESGASSSRKWRRWFI
ncbi:hypothetical protein FB567DRAFT_606213 [Paraphoma chrysanthemicola]|uniref:1-alkyl-2-acetylglycerophosphocholine esterase n=1 Tax=Paraphoma chrysanthemicola TaxID=798071 RepID=A0A8K0R2I1_9PLEO|nr:hypothetical protein FB567DRAFT_606213 [Paraphoma chrysanthemicola]